MPKTRSETVEPETQAKNRESAIHVTWNGRSEVRDLGTYFHNSPSLKQDLRFLRKLQKRNERVAG
jgi:hypothetical protein